MGKNTFPILLLNDAFLFFMLCNAPNLSNFFCQIVAGNKKKFLKNENQLNRHCWAFLLHKNIRIWI
jgi:hypothetical protein